ncbi:sugar ABC transporter substrate-binding protein [Alicyclobacillus tolerans]|uniref:sugar ABC transporter substrate-binding protein n=1 Tax=Alicyclobacillus tolerans TaxID=90970 RepID=UPI001F3E2796|nr:sugar ABC transporter substrate-binding protein [Alicyclobacillus tolerans]MCF8567359.1 sugar ABC transporter substrate-binding protein [Alicyclobacillus tolerans]
MRTWRKGTLVGLSLMTMAGVVAGCGSTTSSNSTSGGTPANSSSSNSTGSQSSSNSKLVPLKQITIGYSVSTLTNQFFVGLTAGVKREAKALGVNLIFDNAEGNPGTQTNQVEELVSRKVNAIILNPIDAHGIIPAVQQANAAGIPVITLDRTAEGGTIDSFVRNSSKVMSEQAAQWIADQLKARYGSYKGNVVDLEGLMSTSPGQARQQGFVTVMKKYPNIHVIATLPGNFDQQTSYNDMLDVIRGHSGTKIDAVFNGNDDNAVGAERAIQQQGLFKPIGSPDHILIASMDGTAQALAAIKSGQQDMTVSQNPLKEAEAAVQIAVEKIEGKSIPSNVHWPSMMLTPKNINSTAAQQFGLWSLSLNDSSKGNIPNMNSLPIYNSNGSVTGSHSNLYSQISK